MRSDMTRTVSTWLRLRADFIEILVEPVVGLSGAFLVLTEAWLD